MTIKRRTKKRMNKTKHKKRKLTYKIVGGMFNGILSGNGLNVGKFSNALTVGSKTLGIHSSQLRPQRVGTSPTGIFSFKPSNFQPKFQTSRNNIKKSSKESDNAGPQESNKTNAGPQEGNKTNAGPQEGNKTNAGPIPTLPGGLKMPDGMPALPGGLKMPDGMPALPGGLKMPDGMPALPGGVNGLTNTLTKGVLPDPTLALSKSGLDDSSGLLSKLKILKAYPMGSLLIKTVIKSYENVMLFQHILKSKTLKKNKYKKQINILTPEQKKDFDIACCLIKKFYIKDIAKNYSYFRDTDYITENCKVVRYIKYQIKLFNSIATKYQKNFTEVFSNNITKFANIENNIGTKTIDKIQQEIEDAFTIGKNNYSYIILFLLHDIGNGKMVVGPNCEYTHKEEKCALEETVNAMFT
jgi:hypothetical protein